MEISEIPSSLYRFIPDLYVDNFMNGELRFGSLSYYQNIEDSSRRDVAEGRHIDRPGSGVSIKNLSTGKTITGDFAFHNSVKNPSRVFCLCFSKLNSREQLLRFDGAQKCIEILNPIEFLRRTQKALPRFGRTRPVDGCGVMGGHVCYYDQKKSAPLDVKNPYKLPFLKDNRFAGEDEYRFVFGRKGAFELVQSITNSKFDIEAEVSGFQSSFAHIQIGDIRDIARVVEFK